MLAAAGIPEGTETTLLVLGGLLVVGALGAGLARRSFLSLTAAFVIAGFVLGRGGLEVLTTLREQGPAPHDPRCSAAGASRCSISTPAARS